MTSRFKKKYAQPTLLQLMPQMSDLLFKPLIPLRQIRLRGINQHLEMPDPIIPSMQFPLRNANLFLENAILFNKLDTVSLNRRLDSPAYV